MVMRPRKVHEKRICRIIIIHDFGIYHHVTSSPDHLVHPISTKSSSLTILNENPRKISDVGEVTYQAHANHRGQNGIIGTVPEKPNAWCLRPRSSRHNIKPQQRVSIPRTNKLSPTPTLCLTLGTRVGPGRRP